ncbi:glycosyltransferase family 9 protein [Paracoccus benzoatiresistens]|uniref:Glycosyltransferase family 9 protein n=1 Tax=Paracoccus benzoatiresistens TaxID=2997341 RepID=A0ABT4JB35_9RHOB|nr:glycosyltransferase family 9 protein [Paracoccus sp. EF6]MCZ0963686.1 hypothetical protein [Paracoccus sp. EF6]
MFALPCFHAIRKHFAGRRIVLLTNVPVSGKAAPLMSILGSDGQFADQVIDYPLALRDLRGILTLRAKVRATGAREAVYLMPVRSRGAVWRDWLFLLSAGVRKVYCLPSSDDLRRPRRDPVTGEIEREASRLARCCKKLGSIDLLDRANWNLELTEAERSRGEEICNPLAGVPIIAVNMGGKAADKDWGMGNWVALRELISSRGRFGMLVVGAGEDVERAETFLSGWDGPGVNACGQLSPRESAAALSTASLFIGHDSGPLHMASAEGVPSIGVFGNFNEPCQWHPVGSHVHIIHRMEGLHHITPQEVFRSASELLGFESDRETLNKVSLP